MITIPRELAEDLYALINELAAREKFAIGSVTVETQRTRQRLAGYLAAKADDR